jgi:hypothetical protein
VHFATCWSQGVWLEQLRMQCVCDLMSACVPALVLGMTLYGCRPGEDSFPSML